MKIFTKLLFILFVISAFVGLAAGLYAQTELLHIGVGFTAGISIWGGAVKVHAVFLLMVVPILLFCLNMLFLMAPYVRPKTKRLFVGLCSALFIVLLVWAIQAFMEMPYGQKMYDNAMIIGVLLFCVFAQSVYIFARIKSPSAIIYAVLVLLPFSIFLLVLVLINENSSAVETYLVTAAFHAEGISLVLLSFASASLWIERYGRRLKASISILHAVLMVGFGIAMVFAQLVLGLAGSPQGYNDYPQDYAQMQYLNSIAGFVFLLVIIIGIIHLLIAKRKPVAPRNVDVF